MWYQLEIFWSSVYYQHFVGIVGAQNANLVDYQGLFSPLRRGAQLIGTVRIENGTSDQCFDKREWVRSRVKRTILILGFYHVVLYFSHLRPSKKKCLFAKIRMAKIMSTRQAGNILLSNFQTMHTSISFQRNKRNKRTVKVKHSYSPKHLSNNKTRDVSL